jgi:hypothetical protein
MTFATARGRSSRHSTCLGKLIGECFSRHRHEEFSNSSGRYSVTPFRGSTALSSSTITTHKHPSVKGWIEKHLASICTLSQRVPLGLTSSSVGLLKSHQNAFDADPSKGLPSHPILYRPHQHQPKTLRLDKTRRPNRRKGRAL